MRMCAGFSALSVLHEGSEIVTILELLQNQLNPVRSSSAARWMCQMKRSSPTVRCQRGVPRLWDAPGAPLGATLATGAHPEQIICVRVQVQDQKLTVPPDVGILILAPPAAGPPVLQPIICRCEVLVHLKHALNNKVTGAVRVRQQVHCT